jgi:hypothetical protein
MRACLLPNTTPGPAVAGRQTTPLRQCRYSGPAAPFHGKGQTDTAVLLLAAVLVMPVNFHVVEITAHGTEARSHGGSPDAS